MKRTFLGSNLVRAMAWAAAATCVGATAATLPTACSDDDADAPSCSTPGGKVAGEEDAHCSAAQPVSDSACHPGGAGGAGGGGGAGGMDEEEEMLTLFNGEGDDDDCKYHVTWSSTPVCENTDVTFTVKVELKSDGSAAAEADTEAEVFLDETHVAPNSGQHTTETAPGTYEIGPIRFDAPGRWTVRFHFYEDCSDAEEESPHGHTAFFVDVP